MVGTFPLSEILNGKHIAMFSKRRYMFIQNVAMCFPKKKKKEKTVGTFPLSEILNEKRTKILGKHIATFLKRRYMFPKKRHYVFPKFFRLDARVFFNNYSDVF